MKNNRIVKAISVILLASCFLAIAAGSGSGTNETASKVGEVNSEDSSSSVSKNDERNESTNNDESKSDSESEKEELQDEYHVGDILQTKGLKIVYVESGEYISDNQFIQPKDGYKYIYIKLYCENTSDSDENISYYDFDCYADGYACDMKYSPDDLLSATMSPGRSTTGSVYFEVPVDSNDIQIEYEANFWSNKKINFIYDGNKDSGFVPEANTASSENAFKKGDIVETKSLRITYLSCGEYTSDNMFIQPAEGNRFIYFEFEFENISNYDEFVSSYDFDCFADGANCDSSYASDEDLNATISAGRKTKGKVTFEVPINAQTIEAEYVDNMWTSSRIIFAYS